MNRSVSMSVNKIFISVCLSVMLAACTEESPQSNRDAEKSLAPLPLFPVQISTTSDPVGISKGAVNVQFQIDNSGNGMAIWNQYADGYWHVYGNEYSSISGWGSPFLIDSPEHKKTWQHNLSLNKLGDAIVTWRDDEKGWYKFYIKGIGWKESQSFSELGTACHKVQIHSDRTALCVYTKWTVDHYSLFSRNYSSEIGWSDEEIIDNAGQGSTYSPMVVTDEDGIVTVIWKQYSDIDELGSIASVWSNRYMGGIGWGVPGLVESNDSGNVISTDIAISENGDVYVTWDQYDGPSYLPSLTRIGIYTNIYRKNIGWDGEAKISEDDGHDSISPRIAVNDTGDGLVAWGSSSSPAANRPPYTPSVRANHIDKGVLRSETVFLSSENSWNSYADVSVNNDGKIAVVWASNEYLYSNVFDIETGWRGAELLNEPGRGYAPGVNVDKHGRIMTSWVAPEFQYDGSNSYTFQIWGYIFK